MEIALMVISMSKCLRPLTSHSKHWLALSVLTLTIIFTLMLMLSSHRDSPRSRSCHRHLECQQVLELQHIRRTLSLLVCPPAMVSDFLP